MNNCLFICLFCATWHFTDLKSIPFWLESPSLPNYCRVWCPSGFMHGTITPSNVNIHLEIKESVCSEAEKLPQCAVSHSWIKNASLQILNNLPVNACHSIRIFAAFFPMKQGNRNLSIVKKGKQRCNLPVNHICYQAFIRLPRLREGRK